MTYNAIAGKANQESFRMPDQFLMINDFVPEKILNIEEELCKDFVM